MLYKTKPHVTGPELSDVAMHLAEWEISIDSLSRDHADGSYIIQAAGIIPQDQLDHLELTEV